MIHEKNEIYKNEKMYIFSNDYVLGFFVYQMKTYNKNRKNFPEKNSIERVKIFSVK